MSNHLIGEGDALGIMAAKPCIGCVLVSKYFQAIEIIHRFAGVGELPYITQEGRNDEIVVFSLTVWPSKQARDEGMEK
jgi:uncharacterized protein YbaA (DUF1428 family)